MIVNVEKVISDYIAFFFPELGPKDEPSMVITLHMYLLREVLVSPPLKNSIAIVLKV